MEAYEEKKHVIPHGPGTLYNNKGQFQQGYFKMDSLMDLEDQFMRIMDGIKESTHMANIMELGLFEGVMILESIL